MVVGLITAITRHPAADNLTLCDVDVGGGKELRIVTNAPEVAEGLRVAVAVSGALVVSHAARGLLGAVAVLLGG